ncbi:hypothetical protein JR316_0000129 [Psilocybe cubensis]|uniref:Uncharacterized protein n=1 Tax=Psilocybe cubensis TaxID=181762 RepID=A0ACB8HFZ0_PSICU|nr:hypothetical protein JR316_0000129 [Psilocybe cubensis]KAH9486065.1 hypothetical protein JR316_0000129 [Psilocybe cubensis]
MAPKSILRNGMSMQSRNMLQKSGALRSNLKRPAPLPLSPLSQNASFSVLSSPTGKALKSAHVHFPPSPTQLAATYTTHGPKSYDRGPISVSPNPLNLPGWGEHGFRLSAVPRPFRTLTYQASPVITEFEDPRSPKLPAPAAVGKENRNNSIRFAPFTSVQTSTRSARQSLSSLPRSPYPSAPNSPAAENSDVDLEMETRGRPLTRNRDVNNNVTILDGPSRARARAASIEERHNKRNKKGLTLGGRVSMNPISNVIGNSQFTPGPSPLGRSIFSPAVASLNRPNKPAPLAMDSLTQAFWQSVSLEEPASADEPMVTALEYPESAVTYEEKLDMTLRAAAQPPLMYAAADGALWSPALPVPGAKVDRIRESLMSPGVAKSFESKVVRRDFTAPSPNDPFAAFPSFAAALERGAEQIRYPPRAAVQMS